MDDTHNPQYVFTSYNLNVVLCFLDVIYCTPATSDVAMLCAIHVGDVQCKTREPSSATNNRHGLMIRLDQVW